MKWNECNSKKNKKNEMNAWKVLQIQLKFFTLNLPVITLNLTHDIFIQWKNSKKEENMTQNQGFTWSSRNLHSLVLGDEFTIQKKDYKSVYTLKRRTHKYIKK